MGWFLGPWPLYASSTLWLFQAAAYASRKDWGHCLMAVSYTVATWGLIWAWFKPVVP